MPLTDKNASTADTCLEFMKRVTELKENEIFVFGSNLCGRHICGAAADAQKYFGAQPGVGEGLTGLCYAIPTVDTDFERRSLEHIAGSVERFLQQARNWPDRKFIITPIGCGIAGYKPIQIAPMFDGAPHNCILPPEFNQSTKTK